MTLSSFLLLFAGGCVAGTMGSLLGLGGGIFLIPFLTLVLDLPMHQAIATSIIAVIATSTAGAAINVERRTVHIKLGMILETTTVAGAIVGGLSAMALSGAVLSRIFAWLLIVVAGIMAWRTSVHRAAPPDTMDGILPASFYDESSGSTIKYSVHRIPAAMAVSLLAGNISGLLGVGGGIFKVPAMHLLCRIPMKAATATSNFMIGVTAAASAFIYFAHGHVNPTVASSACLGVLGGSFFGSWLSGRIETRVLTWIFIAVLLLVSVQFFSR